MKNYKPDSPSKKPNLNIFSAIITGIVALAILTLNPPALADPLKNAYQQRIGNYDVQMLTEPKIPSAGTPTNILVRLASVNGDDLVDIPVVIRIVKDRLELERTHPMIVPYGHFTYEYTFAEAGRYVLYIDVNDYGYSVETLTFTFFVNVQGPFDVYLYIATPIAAVVGAGIAGVLIFVKRKTMEDG